MTARQTLFALAAVVATIVVVALVTVQSQAQAQAPRPISLAVVDIQAAFNALDQRKQVEAEITTKTEALQREAQEKQNAIRSRMSDLQVALDPKSEAYKQESTKLEQDAIEFNTWRQFQARKLEMERALQLENLYKALTETIQRIAERDGYDLVLQKDDTLTVTQRDQQALTAMIVQRKVLFASPAIDITVQVIQQANNEFNNPRPAAN